MPRKKTLSKPSSPLSDPGSDRGLSVVQPPRAAPPTVSGTWLLIAASVALMAAAACAWLTLCLLFWQGSWQLLYHPGPAIARTPASDGIAFDSVAFATTETGEPRLKGWWIPAAPDARYGRFTVLYLHGQSGNVSDTVDELAALHALGMNILAFDYRGYGQSQFAHPSEAHWREDADWALHYLTATRHVAAGTIILDGTNLGANLAIEVAASHADLAGVVVESPLDSAVDAIFGDPRARLVPAHLLVRDRFNAEAAANALLIPSLWLTAPSAAGSASGHANHPAGYDRVHAQKALVWLPSASGRNQAFRDAYLRWLDDLPVRSTTP